MYLILLIILILILFGGGSWGYYNGHPYGAPGIGLGGLLIIILIVMLVTGRL
jgi:hypothetical protein